MLYAKHELSRGICWTGEVRERSEKFLKQLSWWGCGREHSVYFEHKAVSMKKKSYQEKYFKNVTESKRYLLQKIYIVASFQNTWSAASRFQYWFAFFPECDKNVWCFLTLNGFLVKHNFLHFTSLLSVSAEELAILSKEWQLFLCPNCLSETDWYSFQKQPPEVFYKKGVLKSFLKFTGKYLY